MTWNIAPESISLVMLGIILIYSRKGSRLPEEQNVSGMSDGYFLCHAY